MRIAVPTVAIFIAAFSFSAEVGAAPGLGDKVYGATLEAGETEFETRYGRLVGGEADGDDVLKLEVAHSFSDRFYGALVGKFERDFPASRKLSAVAVEGIYTLGKIGGIDAAVYGEYEIGLHGSDAVETKLLLEKRAGEFDARVNLIAEKPLNGEAIEFGYAASADVEAIGEFRLGAAAFGDLSHGEHFAGPVIKTEIGHLPGGSELELETGYLFAIGKAGNETDGQFRLLLEFATHF
ncbi:MAG: hypothetical protein ABIW33_08955 [Sphingomicrobium sp.]